ncbi:MAG: lipoate--protein ligase [Solobacterium sp.]|nr:lipoate--protein ligase [Solobacterium sp.]
MISSGRIFITEGTDPYRNLALEELLMKEIRPHEVILYLWQNDRTVVIGRNQNAWQECNTGKILDEGGHVARRKSGGGAVYHDLGNQNYTLLFRKEDMDEALLNEVLLSTVQKLGLNAEFTGRNDLTVNGRKFSGCASYDNGYIAYRHGCILIGTDMEKMREYLTPSKLKLAAKGVASVESRVVNLSECGHVTPALWRGAMMSSFREVFSLNPCEVFDDAHMPVNREQLAKLTEAYADETWIFGKLRAFDQTLSLKTEYGLFTLRLSLEEGLIRDAEVFTDAMDTETAPVLAEKLKGLPYRKEEIDRAVQDALGKQDEKTV